MTCFCWLDDRLWQFFVDWLTDYGKFLVVDLLIMTSYCWSVEWLSQVFVDRLIEHDIFIDYNYDSFCWLYEKKKNAIYWMWIVWAFCSLRLQSEVNCQAKAAENTTRTQHNTAKQTQQPSTAIHLHFHYCVSLFAISCVETVRFIMHVWSSRAYISLLISFIYLFTLLGCCSLLDSHPTWKSFRWFWYDACFCWNTPACWSYTFSHVYINTSIC